MRAVGKSLQEITDHLNKSGYTHAPAIDKEREKRYKIDTNRVSEFLRDPIYCGVLVFGETIVDLTEIYDFVPMITVEQFYTANKISSLSKNLRSVQKVFEPGKKKADLLRGVAIYDLCKQPFSSGIASKTNRQGVKEYRYYYRCETTSCILKDKSVPARIVLDFAYDFLGNIDLTTQEFYRHTVEELQIIVDKKNTEPRSEQRSQEELIKSRQKNL